MVILHINGPRYALGLISTWTAIGGRLTPRTPTTIVTLSMYWLDATIPMTNTWLSVTWKPSKS